MFFKEINKRNFFLNLFTIENKHNLYAHIIIEEKNK